MINAGDRNVIETVFQTKVTEYDVNPFYFVAKLVMVCSFFRKHVESLKTFLEGNRNCFFSHSF